MMPRIIHERIIRLLGCLIMVQFFTIDIYFNGYIIYHGYMHGVCIFLRKHVHLLEDLGKVFMISLYTLLPRSCFM